MSKTTKKTGKRLSAENIATGKRLLKYIMDLYKYRFIMVFICILLSAVASISVSLSLKYLLDDYIIPLIGQTDPNYAELYKAMAVLGCISADGAKKSELHRALPGTDGSWNHFPDRSNCNIYLYKNDGIHWTGRVKKSARRYV